MPAIGLGTRGTMVKKTHMSPAFPVLQSKTGGNNGLQSSAITEGLKGPEKEKLAGVPHLVRGSDRD